MLVFFRKRSIKLHQPRKNILSLVCFSPGKISQTNTEIGSHIVYIDSQRIVILIFRTERFSSVPGRIRTINSLLELAHAGINGFRIKLRLR